ncbi:MAG: Nif3-like dinuclear metal center hexameric protein [Clostridia bacterium]|nr:Nif3-like dinuclear metal center hexameric protein [Clostridia bacterium]
MKVQDVFEFLNSQFPTALAEGFDNVGLLVGDKSATVTGILVCLDCTHTAIEKATEQGANLIVTHHPIIFSPLKNIRENSLVFKLIKNGISVISMHTNLDVAENGVNDCLCNALGFNNTEPLVCSDGYTIKLATIDECTAETLAKTVKTKLGYPVRYTDAGKKIKTVAVCSGSGGSFLYDAKNAADAFITADLKHNVFYDAENLGLSIIDGGHFATEDIVVEPLANMLKEKFANLTICTCHYTPIKFM